MFFNPFILTRNSFTLLFDGFFNLTGRLGRVPFITVSVVFFILLINMPPLLAMFGVPIPIVSLFLQTYVFTAGFILLFAAIRRAHDVGFTAFVLIVLLIPNYVGFTASIIFLFWSGENKPNRWGDVPSDAGLEQMIKGANREEDDYPF
jgi:uncharacterized membrane protein YhaH (DUF805 family)